MIGEEESIYLKMYLQLLLYFLPKLLVQVNNLSNIFSTG